MCECSRFNTLLGVIIILESDFLGVIYNNLYFKEIVSICPIKTKLTRLKLSQKVTAVRKNHLCRVFLFTLFYGNSKCLFAVL